MTIKDMIQALIDKGHTRQWAAYEAIDDYALLNDPGYDDGSDECSICRRTMRRIDYKYHYHPCE